MSIKDWPEGDRPREKLLQRGAAALSDAELLAIFLRVGVKGKSAVDLARDLLTEFGSLGQMLAADQHRFCAVHGLGEAKFAQIKAVIEMVTRYLHEEIKQLDQLTSPARTRDFLQSKLRGHQSEVFACIFLDNRHRVIEYEELFFGTIDGANVYPREVVKRCLFHNAAAVIFAHNHPSGIAEPSRSDISITAKLTEALKLVDVRVLDHIIVGDGTTTSLAERGDM